MVSYTQAEVLAYQAKFAKPTQSQGTPETGETGEFHQKIYGYLRSQGVHAIVHSRTDKKTTQDKGTADFLCAISGVPLAIEAKSKGKKPTPEQRGFLVAAGLDGWVTAVCWSMEDVAAAVAVALSRAKAREMKA